MTDENTRNSLIQRIEQNVAASQITETIINILKAGLATTPFAGGLASLITDYIPSARFLRVEKFTEEVAHDLNQFAEKVNKDYLHTNDFAFMFEKCFRGVAENPQQEKIQAFRGILVNSAINHDLAEEEKEYLLNLVNNISVLHIRILKFMAMPRIYLREAGIPESQIRGGFSQFFPVAIPGIDIEVIKSAFNELNQQGFIGTDSSIFSTMTSSQGLDLLGNRVTNFGKKFMQFCTSPSEHEEERR